jgi:hypothetical protein
MQQELAGCQFADERLSKRFSMVLKQLAEGTGESMPLACQDWANTKAAYRFFANERVSEADIMAGHFRATREGAATVGGTLLVLHDTTEFSYPRENIGLLHKGRRNWGHPFGLPSAVRYLDALEPGRDASGAAARFVRGEVLDEKRLQRDQ